MRVYEEHHPRAVRAADAVLRDAASAEDVAQEVFAELWSRPARFDPRRGTMGAYVAMRARCRAIDLHRAHRSRQRALDRARAQTPADPAESAADAVVRRELRERVRRALAQLSVDQRAAVLLTAVNGFSVAETATLTGVPLGTAKGRVRLGLRRSRRVLESA